MLIGVEIMEIWYNRKFAVTKIIGVII